MENMNRFDQEMYEGIRGMFDSPDLGSQILAYGVYMNADIFHEETWKFVKKLTDDIYDFKDCFYENTMDKEDYLRWRERYFESTQQFLSVNGKMYAFGY